VAIPGKDPGGETCEWLCGLQIFDLEQQLCHLWKNFLFDPQSQI